MATFTAPLRAPTRRPVEQTRRPAPPRPRTAALATEARWAGIWRLYWPLALTLALQVVVGLVDTAVAGGLGPQALAIVGVTLQVVFMVNALTIAVGVGTHALVARGVGGGAWDEAGQAARQSLVLGGALTLAFVGPLMLAAPALYDALGLAGDRAAGVAYLRWVIAGVVPMNVGIVLTSVLKARGAMGPLLRASAAEAAAWLVGSLGLAVWLGWGLAGLGAGFFAGKAAQLAVAWLSYRRSRLYAAGSWRPCLGWQRRILRVGLPSAFHVLARNLTGLAYYGVLGLLAFPTDVVAAYTIGLRLEAVAYLLVFGLGAVAATMVGQALGAGAPGAAAKAVWRIVRLALGVTAGLAVAGWLGAEHAAMAFCEDPLVWAYATDYVRVTALALPAMGVTVVLNGALQGAGDTKAPLLAALVAQAVGLPLAWALACPLGHGPWGAWLGMAIAGQLQAALAAGLYARGAWATRTV